MTDVSSHASPFYNYLDEAEMAQARQVSRRKLRNERLQGLGPPYVKLDRRILYPVAGFQAWLESITRQPVRANRRPSAEVRA